MFSSLLPCVVHALRPQRGPKRALCWRPGSSLSHWVDSTITVWDTYDMVPLTSNSPCRASAMRPSLFTALLSCSVSIYICQHTSLPQSRLFLSSPICSLLPNPVCKSTSLQAGADAFKRIMSLTQASFPEKWILPGSNNSWSRADIYFLTTGKHVASPVLVDIPIPASLVVFWSKLSDLFYKFHLNSISLKSKHWHLQQSFPLTTFQSSREWYSVECWP